MATKFLAITFFFSLVVILPVHVHYTGDWGGGSNNSTDGNENQTQFGVHSSHYKFSTFAMDALEEPDEAPSIDYLWMYVAFVYLFTGIAIYLIVAETKKIIRVRQGYLGSQSSITDRTIRLSGIPIELRTEDKIKETIEGLEISKVDSVILCKDWKELDGLMDQRMSILRKLEESWTVHQGYEKRSGNRKYVDAHPSHVDNDDEESRLLDDANEQSHVSNYAQDRPMIRRWYGFLSLQSRKVDAIDYYEERLRKLDEQIRSARKKEYPPTPLAFVTMDSTAACVSSIAWYF